MTHGSFRGNECVCVSGRRTWPSSNNSMWSALRCHESSHGARGADGWHISPTLGMVWMGSGRVGDGLPQGERSINPKDTHACMHKHRHMQTHAHDNKIPPNTPVHRILTLVLFLISCTHRRNTIKCMRTRKHTPRCMNDDTANDCFVAHFLQCHFKVLHFQAYPILSIPPQIPSSLIYWFFFRHFRAAHSVLSFFFSFFSSCPFLSLFQLKCVCASDLAMTIFILRKKALQFSSFIYRILFYLISLSRDKLEQ